jgi:hypothetical protein
MNYTRPYMLINLLLASIFMACSSDDPEPVVEEEEPGNTISTGVYTVVNLMSDSTATSVGNATPLYYSLEDNKVIPASQVQTANWDIAFLSIYNSSIAANNGTGQFSPGYGGPGKGGIYLLKYPAIEARYYDEAGKPVKTLPLRSWFDEAFDLTTTVPVNDDQFFTSKAVGLDYFSGSAAGWAYYDFYGEVYPDRPTDEKAHICYALPRPVIVKTAKGNYAKVIIYSMYKGAPEDPDRSHKPGFLTFKYAIQKDGTKNLDIQE